MVYIHNGRLLSHEKETMSFSATEMDPEIIILSEVSQKEIDKYYMISLILCCWRRLLRVPWTARRSNKSILKEINPEYSLAGLILKLKLQYFDHLMRRTDSLEKTLMLGKTEGRRRRG